MKYYDIVEQIHEGFQSWQVESFFYQFLSEKKKKKKDAELLIT